MQANNRVQRTIAVFDDDPDLLEIFRFFLEDSGFKVVLFNNCDDIVDKVRVLGPDLVLMDNWIPLTGGEAAIAQLRGETDLGRIPIILVSAANDVSQVAQRAGADRAVAKPFDFEEILKIIAELLDGAM